MVLPDVRKAVAILVLLSGALAVLPASAMEELCNIGPCCATQQPMDCCTIEQAPPPSPDLVLTDATRSGPAVIHVDKVGPAIQRVISRKVAGECIPFASPPTDRLALLSTYLI